MSLLNIHVRWNILPQYCSERAAEIISVLSRCVLFLLVEIPTTVAGVLWIFVPHYPELWQLETAASLSHRSWSPCRETHHHHSSRNLMSLITKVSFSVNIYQWMKFYCHCQWNPEVPKVSLSQCLKQSIHRTYQGTLLQIFWQIGVGQFVLVVTYVTLTRMH